ncbi:putative sodium-dependent phosphate transporter [Phytophthora cinnamomi]|uniref:putative sodium-dependent phosphate transporter n=1 Tax=Phytophthora cinnamomi TaxID=4785 RepID=UPI003559865B|nr:putative sodium-dependent phosphate transporter [Phytophthora cinnamomi]
MGAIESEKLLSATVGDSLGPTGTHVQVDDTEEDHKYDHNHDQDNVSTVTFARGIIYLVASFVALYFFMVAIRFISDGLTIALGCNTKGAFDIANNPASGLMIGIVTTALLHSSGTVTSIVVALVSSGGMTIRQGVYVIMGANVGTCMTCIMVAFGQVGDRTRFQRAMAAATVHDMYNIWSVVVMFPIEVIFHPLEKMSVAMSNAKTSSGAFNSPADAIVNPLTQVLLVVDKKAIYKVTTDDTLCTAGQSFVKGGAFEGSSLSDRSIGAIIVVIGFCVLVCARLTLVKTLAKVFMGPTKKLISKLLNYNGYVNICVGTLVTFAVHSSTVVTSTLTPMAGLGVITLEQVYPLVIGANLGTTDTALLASLVTGEANSVAIALVHFWFNVLGVFLFYPISITRKPILDSALALAFASAAWPLAAVLFVVVLFIIAPAILLVTVSLCTAQRAIIQALGWMSAAAEVALVVYFLFWYEKKGGRARWHAFLEKRSEERDGGLEWFHTHEMT